MTPFIIGELLDEGLQHLALRVFCFVRAIVCVLNFDLDMQLSAPYLGLVFAVRVLTQSESAALIG